MNAPPVRSAVDVPDGTRWWLLGLLMVAAFGLSLFVQTQIVPMHSGNNDEGVYLFQARMLQEGMLTLPADEHGEFFRPWLSGERDGRIFLQYQPGFPAFLAAADWLVGSYRVALAAVAALTVVAVHGLTDVLMRHRATALVAASLVSLSPLLVLHSALVLTYMLTVFLLTATAWALLTAVDRGSTSIAVIAGVCAGAATTVRPFDVVLMLGPLAVLALHRHRRERRAGWDAAASLGGAAALGAVPFVALLLWYNTRTTGALLEFPNMAADPLNTFGFGTRRLVETEPVITYGLSEARRALWENVRAVPSWLLGGPLLLAAAAMGLLRRGRAPERVALGATALAFPAGYLFWWATLLSGEAATNGIGPHYYIPAFVPLGILAARGLTTSLPARPAVWASMAVLLVAVTAWAIPDKLDVQRAATARARTLTDLVPDDLSDAVVMVDYGRRPYLLAEYPYHRPDPTLQADVLLAADRGELALGLLDRFPERRLYRLRAELQPEDELFSPTGSFRALDVVTAPALEVSVRPDSVPEGRYARAYLTVDGETRHVDLGVIGPAPVPETAWHLVTTADGGDPSAVSVEGQDPVEVLVGVEHAPTPAFEGTERIEMELGVARADGELRTLFPGRGWRHLTLPGGPVRLLFDVRQLVEISISAR